MTEFASIYDKFLSRIEDYGYAQMSEEDLNAHLRRYLSSAIAKFKYVCRKDLELTSHSGFLETLDEMEEEILASWMLVEHIEGNMVTEENMRNFLNSRDYRQYSSANLLKVLQDTRQSFFLEAQSSMNTYDFQNFKRDWKKDNGK